MNETTGANPYLVPGAVILAGLLIAGAVYFDGGTSPNLWGNERGASAVDSADVKIEGAPFIGSPDAPVTIAYWADYQCPFCKRFDQETMPQIIEKYVDTGKAKIVFKDLAFLGPDSQTAALYGRAVWELYPGQFYAWHAAMYAAQDEEHGGFGDEPSIQALTKKVAGIDAAKVIAAVKANAAAYEALIAADRAEAQSYGISATPSFIIGTEIVSGAQPYANFEAAIEAALN